MTTWTRVIIDDVTIPADYSLSTAYGVSADGSVIVGQYIPVHGAPSVSPFKWTQATGIQSLPVTGTVLPITGGIAYSCSADGSVIGGNLQATGPTNYACVWIGGTLHLLDALSPVSGSTVNAVSGDGGVFVGQGGGTYDGVYWPGVGTSISLPIPAASSIIHVTPTSVNSDGSVIVGYGQDGSGHVHGLVWLNFVTCVDIGLPGTDIRPIELNSVSSDGTTAVGFSTTSGGANYAISYNIGSATFTTIAGIGGVNNEAFGVNSDGTVSVSNIIPFSSAYITQSGSSTEIDNEGHGVWAVSANGLRPIGGTPALYWTPSGPPPPGGQVINMGTVQVNSLVTQSPCMASLTDPPSVFLRWSDTRGATWGNPVGQDWGANEYAQLQWNRTGYARDRVYEVYWSVAAPTALNGAFVIGKPLKS